MSYGLTSRRSIEHVSLAASVNMCSILCVRQHLDGETWS